jgi:hypothetical protein
MAWGQRNLPPSRGSMGFRPERVVEAENPSGATERTPAQRNRPPEGTQRTVARMSLPIGGSQKSVRKTGLLLLSPTHSRWIVSLTQRDIRD